MINNEGRRAITIQADVSQDKEVREMVDNIVQQFGTIICAALEQEAMTGQIITVDSGQTL
jgi:NAD(P)-dependent dehydrogenase (short-subunit alcohol dehydrogenase family)